MEKETISGKNEADVKEKLSLQTNDFILKSIYVEKDFSNCKSEKNSEGKMIYTDSDEKLKEKHSYEIEKNK